ncbi:MAG: peptide deformylase [Alphaproteobacteria bacterium CG11_big_fil_rev_8_21_14_0_20_39_49]|nr:MAG: peptide deformylase [Alphaproteobacteria bacterium CG11_big_fil_rev_8_21_14_0_20_39_49]
MPSLQLVLAPDPIFKKKSEPVDEVTDEIRTLMDDMTDTLKAENGVGIAAPMVDVLKRVIVINLSQNDTDIKLFMANPEIIEKSDETQVFEEASLCFPGISADITRPKRIKVKYLDYDGKPQVIEAEGFLATCIQHEADYLDGVVYLDYLSKLKRDTLMRKMNKFIKKYGHGHACSTGCEH